MSKFKGYKTTSKWEGNNPLSFMSQSQIQKRLILVVISFYVLSSSLLSQELSHFSKYNWQLSVFGSFQKSSLINQDDVANPDESNLLLSFGSNYGVALTYNLNPVFSIQTGIRKNIISQKYEGQFEYLSCDDTPPFNCYTYTATYNSKTHLSFLQIPIGIKQYLSFNNQFRFLLNYGINFSFLRNAYIETNFDGYIQNYSRTFENTARDYYFTRKGIHPFFGFGIDIFSAKRISLSIVSFFEFSAFDIENKKLYDYNSSLRFPIEVNVHTSYNDVNTYLNRPVTRNYNYSLSIILNYNFGKSKKETL